ncbi:MAG: hypothetical protein ACYTGH_01485 [Planctomycetota bacterium]|jgi:hypothetical protein
MGKGAVQTANFHPALQGDSEVRRILPAVLQHGCCRDALVAFMNRVAGACDPLTDSARTGLLFAWRIARETDTVPPAEMEMVRPDGVRILVHTVHPIVRELSGHDAPATTRPAASPGFSQVAFEGMAGIRFRGFAALQRIVGEGRLNPLCVEDFLTADGRLIEPWCLDPLFQYYAECGNSQWVSPVRELAKLNLLDRRHAALRRDIIDIMVDAGRLGFCPTQFLRKVILPQWRRLRKPGEMERSLRPLFRMLVSVQDRLTLAGGDGSVNNLFTLKYFVHNVAQPNSRLLQQGFYDHRGRSEAVLEALGNCWVEAQAASPTEAESLRALCLEIRSAVTRAYVQVYLNALVAIETPYEIVEGFRRATAHIRLVSGLLSAEVESATEAEALFEHLRLPTHLLAFDVLERATGMNAALLGLLARHLDVVETFIRTGRFGLGYRTYLGLLGRGAFETPEDMDFYIEMLDRIALTGSNAAEAVDFLSVMIRRARTPEAREELIAFMNQSRFLDRSLFEAWQGEEASDRAALLEAVDRGFQRFLYAPTEEAEPLPGGVAGDALEVAFALQLVRSSGLNKQDILRRLQASLPPLPPIPPALRRPLRIQVRACVREGRETPVAPDNLRYLQRRAGMVAEAAHRPSLEKVVGLVEGLMRAALRYRDELEEEAARAGAAPDGAKKSMALREQRRRIEPFFQFCESLGPKGCGGTLQRSRLLFAALLALGQVRGFQKKHAGPFGHLVLAALYQMTGEMERTLSPYAELSALDGTSTVFSLEALDSLQQVLAVNTRRVFEQLFADLEAGSGPGPLARYGRLLDGMGLGHLVEEGAQVRADFFFRAFVKAQGVKTLEDERKRARRAAGEREELREVALVPGRAAVDQFFGAVGENCTSMSPMEITRQEFIPVRIVDTATDRLEGYLHLIEVRKRSGHTLLVPGIEPKESYLAYLDPVHLYREIKRALIAWARAGGYGAVALPENWVALSNREPLMQLMQADVRRGEPVDLGDISFPRHVYPVGQARLIWQAS